jgi:hypothetical protein
LCPIIIIIIIICRLISDMKLNVFDTTESPEGWALAMNAAVVIVCARQTI